MIEQVNEGVESNDDDAPPELEPQSPALQKVAPRSSAGKHDVSFGIWKLCGVVFFDLLSC